MTCSTCRELLHDYVDDVLHADQRRLVEEHLDTCAQCRTELGALRSLLEMAQALPREIAPSRDLWAQIEARISSKNDAPWWHGQRLQALAAVLLLGLAGTITWALTQSEPGPTPLENQAATVEPPPTMVMAETPTPLPDWEKELLQASEALATELETGRHELDPGTMLVVEENLQIIDQAIEACRAALAAQPDNTFLERNLAVAWRHKLHLLETASKLTRSS